MGKDDYQLAMSDIFGGNAPVKLTHESRRQAGTLLSSALVPLHSHEFSRRCRVQPA